MRVCYVMVWGLEVRRLQREPCRVELRVELSGLVQAKRVDGGNM